jgi:hypothetical protein
MLRPFLRVVTLLKQTNTTLKYEVFLRLNRGGESLNAQEIRNVAFRGNMNDAIYELADSSFLRNQLKISDEKSSAYRNMNDAEYVLRFLTLEEKFQNFSGSLVREMDDFMERNQLASTNKISASRTLFSEALDRCEQVWGEYAFKRPEGNGWRDQLLAGMYDAQMISISQIGQQNFNRAASHSGDVLRMTRDLFDDENFDKAVRTGTNTPARISYRIERMTELLKSI